MGQKNSRGISLEDAQRLLTPDELATLKTSFHRLAGSHKSYSSAALGMVEFSQSVLASTVPRHLVSAMYNAFDPGQRGISCTSFLCGMAVFLRGSVAMKTRFVFDVYDVESEGCLGPESFQRLLVPGTSPGATGTMPPALKAFFSNHETMSFEQFESFVAANRHATSLVAWIFQGQPSRPEAGDPDANPATFYGTLSAVTQFTEKEVVELDRCYWRAKNKGRSGRFDAALLRKIACPPLSPSLATRLCAVMDRNGLGHVYGRELVRGLGECCRGSLQEQLQFCFKFYDVDGDGVVSRQELLAVFGSLHDLKQRANPGKSEGKSSLPSASSSSDDDDDILVLDNATPRSPGADTGGQDGKGTGEDLRFQLPVTGSAEHDAQADEVLAAWAKARPEGDALLPDEFVAWATDSGTLQPILSAFLQMLHVSLGLRPETPEEEAASLRPLIAYHQKLGQLPGETYYVTSTAWWLNWKRFVGLERRRDGPEPPAGGNGGAAASHGQPAPGTKPGRIDNSPLVAKQSALGGTGGVGVAFIDKFMDRPTYSQFGSKLKRPLGHQYVLLPEAVWAALHTWYGGGPILPRPIIELSTGRAEAELFPITLRILRHSHTSATRNSSAADGGGGGKDQTAAKPPTVHSFFSIECSRAQTVRQVATYVCLQQKKLRNGHKGLRAEDVRLWDYRTADSPRLLEDLRASIEACGLADNQQVLMEVRNADLSWPSELYAVSRAQGRSSSAAVETKLATAQAAARPVGVTGLSNLGNTCFLNSSLQCVSNCRPLREYFLKRHHGFETNRDNPLGLRGVMAHRFGELLTQLWSGKSSVAPLQLRRVITRHKDTFDDNQQHDAQELLNVLLDYLHEDLNRVTQKPYVERKDSDGRPDTVVASECWEAHLRRNQSIIVDLFHGQLRSSLQCQVCKFESVTFDPYTFLTLPLPTESTAVLDVQVIRLDGSVPMCYCVEVERGPTYKMVLDAVAELSGLDPAALVMTDNLGPCVQSVHRPEAKVRKSRMTMLTAYEVDAELAHPPPESPPPEAADPPAPVPDNRTNGHRPDAAEVAKDPADGEPAAPEDAAQGNETANGPAAAEGSEPPTPVKGALPVEATPPASTASTPKRPPSNWPRSPLPRPLPPPILRSVPGHLIALHRKRLRIKDPCFVRQFRAVPFGSPVFVPFREGATTHRDLYAAVWRQVARFVSREQRSIVETSSPRKYPFTLKLTDSNGSVCGVCSWNRFCVGCVVPCDEQGFNRPVHDAVRLSIDWDMKTLFLFYEDAQERCVTEHQSVKDHKLKAEQPIDFEACLKAFSEVEQLDEEDNWYCSKCKKHQRAKKQLRVWSLPPLLIVHLKRFQNVNGAWIKSQKRVKFPVKGFDAVELAVGRMAPPTAPPPARDTATAAAGPLADVAEEVAEPPVDPESDSELGFGPEVTLADLEDDTTTDAGFLADATEPEVPPSPPLEDSSVPSPSPDLNGIASGPAEVEAEAEEPPAEEPPAEEPLASVVRGTSRIDLAGRAALTDLGAGESRLYDLYAVANHVGIMGGGHYVTYARNTDQKWYLFNDSSVKEIPEERVAKDTPYAYMLFYERRGLDFRDFLPKIPEGATPVDVETDIDKDGDGKNSMGCVVS